MENKDFQNNMRTLIYEEFQKRLGEQTQPKESTSQLDEFDYDETKDILFRKFEEMSKMKFGSEENYIECCKAMNSIAMTLLQTE